MGRGELICFEGIDGSGKTTVARSLVTAFEAEGARAVFVERRGLDYPKEYQRRRMKLYHQVIWEYGEDPIHELGDLHSLYIMAGWFAVLDRCRVQPLLTEYDYVVLDNWYYKFVARYALKPDLDFQHVKDCFSHLTKPSAVVFLDVPPQQAAERKRSFNLAETGRLDGLEGDPQDSFIRYQSAVRQALLNFARNEDWLIVDGGSAAREEVLKRVLTDLRARLAITEEAQPASCC